MLYPARWKKITVDQSKVLKNLLFRYFWATRYSVSALLGAKISQVLDKIVKFQPRKWPVLGIFVFN